MGGDAPQTGRTPAGATFRVPRTRDMFVTLSSPSHWGPAEQFTLLVMLCNVATLLFTRLLPTAFYVANFLLWRAAYNVGLGAVLTAQSDRRSVTRWLADAPPGTKDLVKWLVTKSMPGDYRWSRCPLEFNAWVAFRALSMVVLANDGLTYSVLAVAILLKGLRRAGPFELVVSSVIGAALCVFSVWSKAAAHDCVGDFAWYWGDFFFVMEGELTFDGVFELFPHPMYTVGYSAYYGVSLMTRSYTLLFVSLIAHAAQIVFLLVVEEPHIQKVYGGGGGGGEPGVAAEADGTAPREADAAHDSDLALDTTGLVGLWRPSVFRTGDVALYVLLASTAAVVAVTRPSSASMVCGMLAWRAAHWGGLGGVLYAQSKDRAWTAAAERQGVTPAVAFETWKQLWNVSWVMNHALFVLTAFYSAPSPYVRIGDLLSPVGVSHVLGGSALIWISIGTGLSCHAALGRGRGFFYADFFTPPAAAGAAPPVACYKGVFRYVNNPECVLGYLAYYGVGVILKSWTVSLLAFICHAAHAAFVVLVEMPHLARTHTGVRGAAALERTLRTQAARVADAVPVVGKIRDEVKLTAVRSSLLLTSQAVNVVSARNRILSKKEQLVADVSALNVKLREHKLYLRAVEIQQEARAKLKEFDGEEIVAALERRGVAIERVSDLTDEESEEEALPGSLGGVGASLASRHDVGATRAPVPSLS
jgi:phosphatidylethanolamine N-methyltransferase